MKSACKKKMMNLETDVSVAKIPCYEKISMECKIYVLQLIQNISLPLGLNTHFNSLIYCELDVLPIRSQHR